MVLLKDMDLTQKDTLAVAETCEFTAIVCLTTRLPCFINYEILKGICSFIHFPELLCVIINQCLCSVGICYCSTGDITVSNQSFCSGWPAFFCFMDALDTQPQPPAQTAAGPATVHLHHWHYELTSKTRTRQTDWLCCIGGLGILSPGCDVMQRRDSSTQHTINH